MSAVRPTADDLAAAESGAMSVTQACEFSGDSRDRLWQLMDAGVLEWYPLDAQPRGHRRILRRSLVLYIANQIATYRNNK